MTDQTEYQRLRGLTKRLNVDPAIAAERKTEATRRASLAQSRAAFVLRHRYADDYRTVYRSELAAINAERGPLPGDTE